MQQHLSFWTKSWPWFLQNLVLLSGRGVKTRGLAQKIETVLRKRGELTSSLQALSKLFESVYCSAAQIDSSVGSHVDLLGAEGPGGSDPGPGIALQGGPG